MFTLFTLAVALIGSAIAGLHDLKTSDIPDKLVFGMAGIGILVHAIQSYLTSDSSYIILSLTVGGIFTIFGILMYYLGAWGGGDGALLSSIGFLLPSFQPIVQRSILPFSLAFFINVFLIGAIYSIIYSAIIISRNQKSKNQFLTQLKKDKLFIISSFIISLALLSIIQNTMSYLLSLLIILILPIYRLAKIAETGLTKKIPAKKLKKGDMVGQDIPKLNIFKKYIRGLTEKEVRKIKKTKKYIQIRDGIRYGPVFFISLLITILYGVIIANLF